MKSVHQLIAATAFCCLSLLGFSVTPSEAATAKNAIQAINVAPQGGDIVIKIDFKEALTAPPSSFSISKPPRIALDFAAMGSELDQPSQVFNQGDLSSVSVVRVGDRTRLVLNLQRSLNYESRIEGNSLLVSLKSAGAAGAAAPAPSRFAEESLIERKHSITDISFRRGKDGEARILVDLSDPGTGIDIRQQGTALIVDFVKTTLPDNLRRRLDVTDFATPVTAVATTALGENTRMVISPKGLWEHTAYQSDNQFVVEVKPIIEDPNKLVQGSKLGYQGPRVSINYQNGDVRALLRLMAEELGLNAVISETVTGTATLVLKDVPADQVVDIIFRQKGLDMRKNGNVILIAPREELALREKLDAEAKQQIGELEPLRMEAIQLNYHKAADVAKLLSGGGGANAQRILSKRGSVTADTVTNKVFVNDIPTKIEEAQRFIKMIDIGSRQVMIEARVVEATDDFNKDLGVRMRFLNNRETKLFGGSHPIYIGGLATNPTSTASTSTGGVVTPGTVTAGTMQPMTLGVNLPSFSNTGGTLAFSLFNSTLTRILNLELAALETDGRGKVVSSPKVVTANNVKATIEDGYEVPYLSTSNAGTNVQFKKAMLSLETTPQITPDGKVKMKLLISKDEPDWSRSVQGTPPIKSSKIETDVVVDNGGTVVIGGVFTINNTTATERVPFLGDLPYLGWLFKVNTTTAAKRELLIFITPRILNEQLTAN
ncbi:MAG: Type IV pilus biogenesis and competence protein PilQ precursor [Betaproteobacteria bacterium ADurb.Bin341]|nr:MAG: Type IV pilus biogenesis and competence protein PilQ precursor [Betaproteobacteria bacterium ADurb.Bin341]